MKLTPKQWQEAMIAQMTGQGPSVEDIEAGDFTANQLAERLPEVFSRGVPAGRPSPSAAPGVAQSAPAAGGGYSDPNIVNASMEDDPATLLQTAGANLLKQFPDNPLMRNIGGVMAQGGARSQTQLANNRNYQAYRQMGFSDAVARQMVDDKKFAQKLLMDDRKRRLDAQAKAADEEPVDRYKGTTGQYRTYLRLKDEFLAKNPGQEFMTFAAFRDEEDARKTQRAKAGSTKIQIGPDGKEIRPETKGEETESKEAGKDNVSSAEDSVRLGTRIDAMDAFVQEYETRKDELSGYGSRAAAFAGEDALTAANPALQSFRQDVYVQFQSILKKVLGGQFTEREARELFQRIFDPRLRHKDNLRKMRIAVGQLRATHAVIAARRAAYKRNKGSMQGYDYNKAEDDARAHFRLELGKALRADSRNDDRSQPKPDNPAPAPKPAPVAAPAPSPAPDDDSTDIDYGASAGVEQPAPSAPRKRRFRWSGGKLIEVK